jgi:hypothetical protein
MNKYSKSDISDGLALIRTGICSIMHDIARGEISEYELDLPINSKAVSDIIKGFDADIKLVCRTHNETFYYKIDNCEVAILQYNDKVIISLVI